MAATHHVLESMLDTVAAALGPELCREMAFVGGCTTALMLTDEISRESVRFTDDVDLIIHVLGFPDWMAKQAVLKQKGFTQSQEDEVICRMRLQGGLSQPLMVDFMPDDEKILGFSNRWYAPALQTAQTRLLSTGREVRVVSPVFFVATKLEAYLGRGNNDPLSSRDIEDILTVVDGRESLVSEIREAAAELKTSIATQLADLLQNPDFDYAVQSAARNHRAREAVIFRRLDTIAQFR